MTQRDEQNSTVLYRVGRIEETMKAMHAFDKEDIAAFDAMVKLYRGVAGIWAIGKWLVVLITMVSGLVMALEKLGISLLGGPPK